MSSLNCLSFRHKAVRLMPNNSVALDLLPPVASNTSSMYFFSISTNVMNFLIPSEGAMSASVKPSGKMFKFYRIVICEDDGTLNDVFKFADIAGEIIGHKEGDNLV